MSSALFLDRDGVVNIDHGYVHTPDKTDFVPGIFPLVAAANAMKLKVVIITNQAGIARGYYDEEQFEAYMNWVRAEFRAQGATIDAVYHCPHHPDFPSAGQPRYCECRKPAPGMLLDASRHLDIDLGSSILIGDSLTDIAAGRAAKVGMLMLLRPQNIADPEPDADCMAVDDLNVARTQMLLWAERNR